MSFVVDPSHGIIRVGSMIVDDGSTVSDTGLVGKLKVDFDEIKNESPIGDVTTGYNVKLAGEMQQTKRVDVSAAIGVTQILCKQFIFDSEDDLIVIPNALLNAAPALDFAGGESFTKINCHKRMSPPRAKSIQLDKHLVDADTAILDYDADANPINFDFD